MTAFISAVTSSLNKTTTTENGALSNVSSLNKVLDFFSKSGALRGDPKSAILYFEKAFYEDEELALRALFYMRDIRKGQGERDNFRHICSWLADNYSDAIIRNMIHIPLFGRWDDLYALVLHPQTHNHALSIMKEQFTKDIKSSDSVSLLGKWLKSENASSSESKRLGTITRKFFGLSSRDYRKALTSLRNKIGIVETYMTQQRWDEINYSNIPSYAMKLYTKAFSKHDSDRFSQYLYDVSLGKKKINASTLYPYDIVREVIHENDPIKLQSLDCQWNALPNYLDDINDLQALVLADVSGSMECGPSNVRPIDVAISLAIYFAERVKGYFRGCFMTFTDKPSLVKICGDTIQKKIRSVASSKWGYNTNLIAAFTAILNAAIENNVPEEQMPKKLFIISDMQFDKACHDNSKTNFEVIDKMYRDAGYKRPLLVFWNVAAKADSPVTKDDMGSFMVSGCSPSILKYAMNTKVLTAIDLMLEVLNSERYSFIH